MLRRVFFLFSLALTPGLAADPPAPVVVSAANVNIGVTSDSLAVIYGDKLASLPFSASLPWPTSLGDLPFVRITDSASNSQLAPLLYVSPSQINLQIPPGLVAGPATATFPVTGLPPGAGTAALRLVPFNIQKVAPGLFSLDGSGTGIAAASALRVMIPTGRQSPVPVFTCNPSQCVTVPIDVGVDAPVYLSLYGTGLRGASSLSDVLVTIGTTKIKPTYAGPQMQLPGLDQVNVPLPLTLRGSGLVNVTVTADGLTSNAVLIAIQ